MDFKVVLQGRQEAERYKQKEFEQLMGFEFLPRLRSLDEKVDRRVERKCLKALKKGWITQQHKWLGAFYHKEMDSCLCPAIEVRWIDEQVGYGVFTDEPLAPQAFVGEYTGIVRPRKRFKDRQNDYCFEYDLGEWFKSSFLIDAEPAGNQTRFINHSDTPNLEPISIFWEGRLHIILRTLKLIAKGTELTYDYGDEYWSNKRRRKKQQ